MARYTGPTAKKSRRFGEPIFGFCKALERKNYRPGEHGQKRTSFSKFKTQLNEKQKARFTYGISEKQFYNTYKKASKKSGETGEILLQLLECRADNTVYRLGLAPTRRAARQLVNHGHIQINGRTIDIPSYLIQPGDTITIHHKAQTFHIIKEQTKNTKKTLAWLAWDPASLQGKLLKIPVRADIPEKINEQAIVEFYSKN